MADEPYSQEFIDSLVKRSGQARATVYRKLGAGWTEAEIVARRRGVEEPPAAGPNAEPAPVLDPPPDDSKFAVNWAHAVLWAADHVDTPKKQMTKAKAGSALKYNLFLLGKDDLRELHVNLVPKALNILDKQKNPEGGAMVAEEEKSVAELEEQLKQALEESNRQWTERN